MTTPHDPEFERRLGSVGSAGTFDPSTIAALGPATRRYFTASIAPGTPLHRSARLRMRGHIKIGRWLRFTATEELNPLRGFVWRARVAGGLITGSDRYVDRSAAMQWKLCGVVPIVRAAGPDLTRSAAARAGAESLWLPTAMLPGTGVEWHDEGANTVSVQFSVDDVPLRIDYQLDERGQVRSGVFDRWGDPDRTGSWGWHCCGGDVTAYRTFGGITIPSAGSLGWHYGTDRWPHGEFFRYEITDLAPAQTA
jgi:hypothetical protein